MARSEAGAGASRAPAGSFPGKPPRRADLVLADRGGMIELLRVPSFLFGAFAGLRDRCYRRGILPAERLDVPVISIGNLTAGGTGKTPFVVFIARELQRRGLCPGIASRGHGAPKGSAERENDEARLLERLLPGVPRRQDPDRERGARALQELGVDVVLLDDGFQRRSLARDLDVVLVDATRPWGLPRPAAGGEFVRALLPRGLLREPPSALARAHAIVITRADLASAGELAALHAELETSAPGRPVLTAEHRPRALVDARGQELAPAALAGREVDLVSAIGNPGAFQASVERLGARVVQHRVFPDHHLFVASDLAGLGENGRWLVTTEKDAVKFPAAVPEARVLAIEVELTGGAPVLAALLDALPRAAVARVRASFHEGLHG